MKIKNLTEGLNAQQRSVPQLPAQAKPKHISVLGAKTDPKHPFAGYMVGADESVEEAKLDEKCWDGYEKKGMKTMFGKRVPNCVKNEAAERNELDDPRVQAALKKMAERHRGEKWSKEQLAALGKRIAARGQKPVKEDDVEDFLARGGKITHVKPNPGPRHPGLSLASRHIGGSGDRMKASRTGRGSKPQGKPVVAVEDITKEDVISKLKAKLGDYLSDISKEIKKDPDLVDKLAAKAAGDQVGPPVKTITTDDGHQIQIHGNEDDGFRISIKNKPAASRFKNLDEAVMACEMYCAHRRARAESADYADEA